MSNWLSILLPVYNVEEYLSDCFASLLIQDLCGVEIIAVDDQSTDESFSALKVWAASTKLNLRLLRHAQNQGVSAARNSLLEAAAGEYLWFVDPDDVLATDAVRQLKKIIDLHSPDLVMCDYKRWQPDVTELRARENHLSSFGGLPSVLLDDGELLFKGLYQQGRLHCWSKISKRNLWDETLRFPVGRCFEDVALMPRLTLRVKNYFYQDSVWIHYRQRPGSILATPSLKKIEDMSVGMSGVLNEWLQHCPNMSASTRRVFNYFCLRMYRCAIRDLVKINQLKPEILNTHRAYFYANIKTDKLGLILDCLSSGDVLRLWKLMKMFRYL